MVAGIHDLVDNGHVQVGTSILLDTVPIPFLREVPLVKREWLDHYVIELVEWGALLKRKGYRPEETGDEHPLALSKFVCDRKETDAAEVQVLRQKAVKSLAKFPGRTKKIDGRPYVSFKDYQRWKGGMGRGKSLHLIKEGFVMASWNKWIDSQDEGNAAVAGVSMARLENYAQYYPSHVCPDTARQLNRREQLLDSLRLWRPKSEEQTKRVQDWKLFMEVLLRDLYSFQDAVTSISRSYYDDHEVLFSTPSGELVEIIKYAEELVADFNEHLKFIDQ